MRSEKSGARRPTCRGLSIDSRTARQATPSSPSRATISTAMPSSTRALNNSAGPAMVAGDRRGHRPPPAARRSSLMCSKPCATRRAPRGRAARQDRCRHRHRRQDRHQGDAQARARRRRRDACFRRLLQQSLGCAADARPTAAHRQMPVRNRRARAGEITPLTQLVRPHVAIVTTIEPVHLEFFATLKTIAEPRPKSS